MKLVFIVKMRSSTYTNILKNKRYIPSYSNAEIRMFERQRHVQVLHLSTCTLILQNRITLIRMQDTPRCTYGFKSVALDREWTPPLCDVLPFDINNENDFSLIVPICQCATPTVTRGIRLKWSSPRTRHTLTLPSVWLWSCHYLFFRLRSVAAGIRTPNLPHARRTLFPTAPLRRFHECKYCKVSHTTHQSGSD